MTGGYWELAVAVSDDAAEPLTNFLWELGALGVVEEAACGAAPVLRAFFPGHADGRALEARVGDYVDALRALGVVTPPGLRVAPVADADWAVAWREHFRPLAVGRRLLVAPPWDAPSVAGRVTIVIEPARAFGTGHHGTTAGCLERLEAVLGRKAPAAALDLGTGSGILAIAAARLGVPRVLAVDDDPDAVAAASVNAAANGVADRVTCVAGDAGALDTGPVALVLANLLSGAHLRLAPRYAGYVERGGALVLGGILDAEAAAVAPAVCAHGFRTAGATSIAGWTTLELERT